jgi:hypothetical protein
MTQDEQAQENALGIQVINERMTVTYEQTLQLRERTKITQALAWLQTRLSRAGLTGQITSEHQSGGCRRVIVRHVGNIPIGSDLQRAVEDAFEKKKLTE